MDTEFFKNIVDSCRSVFDCQVSLISVVDEQAQRQLHWAQAGLSSAENETKSLPLSHSICKKVIATGEALIINDTKKDEEFLSHPAIHAFNIRSYLGVPIRDDENECIAALCVADTTVRKWTEDDVKVLEGFASGLSTQVRQIVSPDLDKPIDVSTSYSDDGRLNTIQTNISFQQDSNGYASLLTADPNYYNIWGKTPNADTFDLFDMCVPDEIARIRTSFGIAAMRESVWHQKWAIKCAFGVEKRLSGVGHAKSLPGGFTLWHVLVSETYT
ncbi:GAF domain-containing protein [Paracoccus liaowanqingii]|uniref:GAF domain-containing protein n=1 Tax=Paracoccus liaowanqingii TaxID=2560053 RepID=A0A4Z1CE94_9RHOB|nr:GAF domain-containing protein [Paracoccus liaowanqingii]TGN49294.1 GAF domain-containing protein [Paracoccus liaowanqingii]